MGLSVEFICFVFVAIVHLNLYLCAKLVVTRFVIVSGVKSVN